MQTRDCHKVIKTSEDKVRIRKTRICGSTRRYINFDNVVPSSQNILMFVVGNNSFLFDFTKSIV